MDLPIKEIVDAFKQEFEPQECVEFYQLNHAKVVSAMTKLKQFILHATLSEISRYELEDLFHFIQTDEVMEIFMNELIAPFTPGMMVGESLEGEFMGSIGIYERFAKELDHQQGAIMIAPILVVCSLMQNAYLFINEIAFAGDVEACLRRCCAKTNQPVDDQTIYKHSINLLIKPLLEVLQYRVMEPQKNIPHYIITSFGLISAEYSIGHGKEITQQIEQSLSELIQSISSQNKPIEPIN